MTHAPLRPVRRRTTVDLPVALADEIQRAVNQGLAKSQNSLIVRAVETYLQHLQEAWIDAQFAQMAHDQETQALHLQIAQEFEKADWEAFQLGEANL